MKLTTEQQVHLFHIFFVGSLFLYVGISKDRIPFFLYYILLILGLVVIIYHLYKVIAKKTNHIWVSLIHIILVGPLLLFIGYKKKETSRKFYELLLMLAFASIGYHGFYMFHS